jgi:cobalt-precorrin-5B (C1)-methyltransferase
MTGTSEETVAVRLPSGSYLSVPVAQSSVHGCTANASVIKDAGDDPDITNGAEIRATVTILSPSPAGCASDFDPELTSDSVPVESIRDGVSQSVETGTLSTGLTPARNGSKSSGLRMRGRPKILLIAGEGVGIVTKPGLPVAPGEPAINPVPRQMLSENITLELLHSKRSDFERLLSNRSDPDAMMGAVTNKPVIELPLYDEPEAADWTPGPSNNFSVLVEIEVPRGRELSRHTLNPRLGITGGISILGTTGIVKPFSNEAYEDTIRAAISVAASNRCDAIVLSTGGKSERLAMEMLPELSAEAFVQIADFLSFAVREARVFGFSRIVHSVFFGKAIKMAQGHAYTHAHSVPLDLEFLARAARSLGYDETHRQELASANTARHAIDIIAKKGSYDIIESIAEAAAAQSAQIAGGSAQIRLLLFDYAGHLLADVKRQPC